jgi:hypothetical protein
VAPEPGSTLAVYEKLVALSRARDPARLRKLGRRLLGMHDARLLRMLSALASQSLPDSTAREAQA